MTEKEDIHLDNPYRHFLDTFLLNLYSLQSFANNVSPVLLSELKRTINVETIEEFHVTVLIHLLVEERSSSPSETNELKADMILFLEKTLREKHGVEVFSGGRIRVSGHHRSATAKAIEEFKSKNNQFHILYQSTLISLAIYFEVLIGSIIKQRLIRFPKAAGIESKTLTLEDIRKLGSFENAELYLIEQEIETIIRKKYQDWIDYLKTNMKLKMDYIQQFNDKIVEIIQRRNLFVHNEGIVNNIYLNNINPKLKNEAVLGKRLSIDHDYLEESISTIQHAGLLIGLECWSTMEKESPERVAFILNKGIEFMESKQWHLAKDLFQLNLKEKSISSKRKTVSQINYWLSVKRLGLYSEISKEIEESDFSDKSRDFQICFLALTGDIDKMFEIIPQALESNEVTLFDISSWPVFDEYRNDERYLALMHDIDGEFGLEQTFVEINMES